ncbi:uncharacterized protein (DUF427 family) [Hasllibacter halocynthiae]|uniref:Uncharacterized protein (DUF427 family) n=1 Tax=Hasllibacter halocynthiae TaxID=595589 RepID=A0A2T0X1X9_9RHOB|nr:DUF427 domain-containing protein [Hasllibacter halocynthiae]PRY92956.1 uncharacterized protein (DUF427 family) [Hasllibacter halocynthiae]
MVAPEDVQDYPRPPRLEPAGAPLRVALGGAVVAETVRGWRVLETHHAPTYYLPREDVAEGALRPAGGGSLCEWKGRARYFDVHAGGRVARRAAWSYEAPARGFEALAGAVAFYAGPLEARVGDMDVIPQPGDFYGGWVTPNLRGVVKGGPGTEGW